MVERSRSEMRNVLMISTDRGLLDTTSGVFRRHVEYVRGWSATVLLVGTGESRMVEQDGLQVIALGGRTKIDAWIKVWNWIRLLRSTLRFDLVTAQDPTECGLLGWLAARAFQAPLQVQDHNGLFVRHAFTLRQKLLLPLSRWIVRRADRVRVVSQAGRVGCERIGVLADRMDVLPIATDLGRFASVIDRPNAKHVLCVARLEWEKGIDLLLRAWADVAAREPSARLRFVGDGSRRSEYEALVRGFGIGDSVEFVGQQSNMTEQFGWADVVVQPSRFEGWGLAVIEAAAAGRPIVMTRTGCADEVIKNGENGLVVPLDDIDALSSSIVRLLVDRVLADRLSSGARVAVQSLMTPNQMIERLRSIWLGMIESARPRWLIVTQAVDANDSALAFFLDWIREIAKRSQQVTVVCLRKGEHDLPSNVRVFALDSTGSPSGNLSRSIRFLSLVWRERKAHDRVFVHMNPEYIVLAGWLWRLMGKRTTLWYAHRSVHWKLRAATWFAHAIATTATTSFGIPSDKVHVLGHGIKLDALLALDPPVRSSSLRLVTVGRITPIKRLELVIEATSLLRERGLDARLTFVGAAISEADREYQERMCALVRSFDLESHVVWAGSMKYDQLPKLYQSQDVAVNASPTGGLDKVVFEAMAAGVPAFVLNQGFRETFGALADQFVCSDQTAGCLADRIQAFWQSDDAGMMAQKVRACAQDAASLVPLIERLLAL